MPCLIEGVCNNFNNKGNKDNNTNTNLNTAITSRYRYALISRATRELLRYGSSKLKKTCKER